MIKSVVFAALLACVAAIPVDNGVEGDPEIECGPTSITVNFNTQNNFQGHVYVKGLFDQAGCRNDEGGRQVAGIELPFDTCSVARTRSLNPKGVFVTTTVIISFHPKFETKVDRAYKIQCFYMEADKTVSAELEVSMLTTGFQTQLVPMPVCRYEILSGGPTGTPVKFALVGDSVYHKWTCDTETVDTFCMVVHSCFVDDGNGDKVDLLTTDGCAVDKFLLNNLEYPTDLMAGQEAHVFKYADRAQLFFQCQITISVKEPNAQCIRPECAPPAGFGPAVQAPAAGAASAGAAAPAAAAPAAAKPAAPAAAPSRRRQARQAKWEMDNAGTLDVRAEVNTVDIDDQPRDLPQSQRRIISTLYRREPISVTTSEQGMCISTTAFATFFVLALALIAAVVVIAAFFMFRRSDKN